MANVNFNSHRSPLYSKRGIVATAGGCGYACSAVLNAAESTSTGIGYDIFALYFASQLS